MFHTRLHGLSLISSGYEEKRSLKSYIAVGLISLGIGIFGTRACQKRLEDKVNELTEISCNNQREMVSEKKSYDNAFYGFLQGEEFRKQISEANSFLEETKREEKSFKEFIEVARAYFGSPEIKLKNLDIYQKEELGSINEFLDNYEDLSTSYLERLESTHQLFETWCGSETKSERETIKQMRKINNSYISALAQVDEQSAKERKALTLMMNYIERYAKGDSDMIDQLISHLSRRQEIIRDSNKHKEVFIQNNNSSRVLPVYVETKEKQIDQTAVNYNDST